MKRNRILRTCAAMALSFTMLLGLAVPAAAANVPAVQPQAAAAAPAEADYEQICDGGYKIEGSGYLFVGSEKAVMFDGSTRAAAVQATVQKLAGDREVTTVSTAVPNGRAVELGGLTFQAIPVNGTLTGTVYFSAGRGVLVSGDLLGSGTVMLNRQYPLPEAGLYIDNYRAYLDSLDQINAKVGEMKSLTVCASGAQLDKQYFSDLYSLVTRFVKAEDTASFVLKATTTDGTAPDFIAENGSAKMCVHMPVSGLYGYEFGGTTICTSYDQYRFFVCDYGKFMTIRDSDIQSCYLLMNDDEALIVDVTMYNPELFWATLDEVIGDRKLSVYITHSHGDHWMNLEGVDPDRIETIYWPEDDEPSDMRGYNPWKDERLEGKFTFVKEGDEINIAGRELLVANMYAHTPHGTVLIDKTDRVMFSGDALGTLQYVGGTLTQRLTAEEYLADLNRITDDYGQYFDEVYQAHSVMSTPGIFNTLKTLVTAFIEQGPNVLVYAHGNGAVYSFMDQILTAQQVEEIMNTTGLCDAQIAYCGRLEISQTALDAYNG